VNGTLKAPTSKSYMQRVLALALLNPGETTILNPGKSADDVAALSIIENLGAKIRQEESSLIVNGVSVVNGEKIHAGESGLSLRMFTPIAALSTNNICITGEGSLLQRPMHVFEEIFSELKVDYTSKDLLLPLTVKGPMQPCNIEMDGSLSSQFLTGFLVAFCYAAKEQVEIKVKELKSKPYINLTLELLTKFGYNVSHNNFETFTINPRDKVAKNITCVVEGDWSGAAFLLVAGAIGGSVTVTGLDQSSEQADKKIMEALRDSKAKLIVNDEAITVEKSELVAFNFDATDCPDLFPPLVALAACCDGVSEIKGVSRLKHKESDRAVALKKEFATLGVSVKVNGDVMKVTGTNKISGGTVHSHHDHRIAMATAIMSTRATSSIEIMDASAVNKSYPHFYDDLIKIGSKIKM
jgi:3-phosphoshikimate 1-carboxyvinyltransferase